MSESAPGKVVTVITPCKYCGGPHVPMHCPRVRAIEYFPDGFTMRRIEFHREDTRDR